MAPKLKQAIQIHRLAADLGLPSSEDPANAIRDYCRKQLLRFRTEHKVKTLSELLTVAQERLGTSFVEVHTDGDIRHVASDYFGRGEYGFAMLEENLAPDVFAITMQLQAPRRGERRFVSVIDCRGAKARKAYYSKWHELAHLMTLTPQGRIMFRRTHMTEETNDPEERLMEAIAGDGGFLPELIRPHTKAAISFAAIARIRDLLCPEASDQASRIGIVNAWPTPCLLLHGAMGLRKAERRASAQIGLPLYRPPEAALRAVSVTANSAAHDSHLMIPPNMRIPPQSVAYRVLEEPSGDMEAVEDLQWWSSSTGQALKPRRVRVVARRAWDDKVDALVVPADEPVRT